MGTGADGGMLAVRRIARRCQSDWMVSQILNKGSHSYRPGICYIQKISQLSPRGCPVSSPMFHRFLFTSGTKMQPGLGGCLVTP